MRLQKARERKGFEGPKAAAVAYGWSPNTYSANENGNAPFSYKAAEKYAARFGVRAQWLYAGEGPMVDEPRPASDPIAVPIIAWVAAGQLSTFGDPIEADDGQHTLISGLPRSSYFATRVQGDSMDRFSPDGSVIVVDTGDVDPRPGRAYVFSLRGETTYKVYQCEPIVRLEPHSTNPAHRAIYPSSDGDWIVVGRVVRTFLDLP